MLESDWILLWKMSLFEFMQTGAGLNPHIEVLVHARG